MVVDTVLGDWFRWLLIATAWVASAATFAALVAKLRAARDHRGPLIDFPERMVHMGGGAICFLVGFAMLGFLLGWDSVFRLPLLWFAFIFVIVGRGMEWYQANRSGR